MALSDGNTGTVIRVPPSVRSLVPILVRVLPLIEALTIKLPSIRLSNELDCTVMVPVQV